MSEIMLKIGQRIECPFCKAYGTKPPSRPIVDYPIWGLPNNSPLKELEADREALVRYVRAYTAWARQQVSGFYTTDDPPFSLIVLNAYADLSAETRMEIEEQEARNG